jgi:hypothetical protein
LATFAEAAAPKITAEPGSPAISKK